MAEAICQEEACNKAVPSLQLFAFIETLSACARNTRCVPVLTPRHPVHFVFLLASKERQRAVMPACVCVTQHFCTT
jgi:hypothetical protein